MGQAPASARDANPRHQLSVFRRGKFPVPRLRDFAFPIGFKVGDQLADLARSDRRRR